MNLLPQITHEDVESEHKEYNSKMLGEEGGRGSVDEFLIFNIQLWT